MTGRAPTHSATLRRRDPLTLRELMARAEERAEQRGARQPDARADGRAAPPPGFAILHAPHAAPGREAWVLLYIVPESPLPLGEYPSHASAFRAARACDELRAFLTGVSA